MEIIYALIALFAIWFFIKYRRLKYLSKIIETIETTYIKDLRDGLEWRVENSKAPKNINFKDIYENHFKIILSKSQKAIEEYYICSNFITEKIEIEIKSEYSWVDAWLVLSDARVIQHIEISAQYKKSDILYLKATLSNFLWLVVYLEECERKAFPHDDDERYTFEIIFSELQQKIVGFAEFWLHKKTVRLISFMHKNADKEKESHLIRLLGFLKSDGVHGYDSGYEEVNLFTGKELAEIKELIDIYFIKKILEHDFKYIGELNIIIRNIEIEYKIKDYDKNSSSYWSSSAYYVGVLEDIKKQIELTASALRTAEQEEMK